MANCSLLLNDGSLLLLNDGTSNLLLNDNSCAGGGSTLATGDLGATGTGTADFISGSFTSGPAPFSMTGTASVLFHSFTDVPFSMNGSATTLFRSFVEPVEPEPRPVTGAGGYAKTWDDHWREKEKRETRRRQLLALIRSSDDYRRLKRKLDMLSEHLLDAKGSRIQTIKVNEKIAEIEAQIEMMERLE
jgi:hypothetical protein